MKYNEIRDLKDFWEKHARHDPLWAILSDPSKKGRKWNARDFFETGQREISILMFRLRSLKIDVARTATLDFGCGVGRLTQALAGYFDRVAGVDISETMIDMANDFNRFPDRVRYICNPSDRLEVFEDGEFDFIYTNIVLQHLLPELTLRYFEEFLRVLRPGGLLIFQLPSHVRENEAAPPAAGPMSDDAYASSLRLEEISPSPRKPSAEISLKVTVKNLCCGDWIRNEAAPIRLGNHWLSGDGKTMLIQDDGRADLPHSLAAGEECLIVLTVKTPPYEGDYQCEIDLVHEGIYWFKDKGGSTLRFPLEVKSVPAEIRPEPVTSKMRTRVDDLADAAAADDIYRALPPEEEDPGEFPMHGIRRDEVIDFFQSRGDAVIRVEDDERGGREWSGFRYFVRKKPQLFLDDLGGNGK